MQELAKYINYISWDSDFFGYKVGMLSKDIPANILSETLSICRNDGYRLIYFKTESDDAYVHQAVLNNSGQLADQKITYCIPLEQRFSTISNQIVSSDCKVITPELLDIVLQTGLLSRFNTDSNFGKAKYEELYTVWISRSLKKEIADEVIFYMIGGIIAGYLTLQFDKNIGHISLVGVDPHQQGKGIGKELLAKAVNLSLDNNCQTLEVPTQDVNIQACRFYESFGFQPYKKEFIYHFWL